jgi:CRP/FNR family transcriptional regulator, cyclic AMP receptor protein
MPLVSAKRELLAEAGFLAGLSAAQFDRLAALGQVRSYRQDTRIYMIGDAVDDFYVLADGMVRFTLGFGKRETSAGEIMRRGDVFGWAALVEGYSRRIATAHCLTPCSVVAFAGANLLRLMESDHSLGYALMKRLAVLLTSELTSFAAG